MSLIRWLRNVPIGILTAINVVLLGTSWLQVVSGMAPTTPDGQRYSPPVALIGFGILAALPYLIVKKEDSGHGFAYSFAYGVLVIFLWLDLDAFARWMFSQ